MMKRTLSLLLILLTAAGIAACGSSDTPPASDEGTVSPTTEASGTAAETDAADPLAVLDANGTTDFGGAVFTVNDANYHPDMHINIPGDEMNGDIVNDALIQRDTVLEDRYNVVIDYVQTEKIDALKRSVQAGDDEYQLVLSTLIEGLSPIATEGMLYNLCDMPWLDLVGAQWSPLMYDSLRLGDAMYYTCGDIAPSIYQAPTCLYLNLKLYSDYDIGTDIYQLVLDGAWTLNALESLTKDMDNDLNGDNNWGIEDFYGIVMRASSETANAFLAGADSVLFSLSDDGTSITTDVMDNASTHDLITRMTALCRTISYDASKNELINDTFKGDRSLFLAHKLESAATHLRDMESDYLILPYPKADESQDSYMSYVSGYVSGFVGIPATADAEFAGFMTEALALYSHEYLRPLAYDLVYKEKTTRDPRSADVLNILFDNLYIDFGSVYNFGGINDVVTNVMFKDMPLTSQLESKRKSIESAVEKFIDSWND